MNAKIPTKDNVTFTARHADGTIKPLFKYNELARFKLNKGFVVPRTPEFGEYVDELVIHNLVTSAGKEAIASRLISNTVAPWSHIAIGSGIVAPSASDTTLGSEITTNGGARAAATTGLITTDVTNDTAQYTVTFTFTGPVTVSETGLFNAASGGTMIARVLKGPASFVAGETLTVTWRLDVD